MCIGIGTWPCAYIFISRIEKINRMIFEKFGRCGFRACTQLEHHCGHSEHANNKSRLKIAEIIYWKLFDHNGSVCMPLSVDNNNRYISTSKTSVTNQDVVASPPIYHNHPNIQKTPNFCANKYKLCKYFCVDLCLLCPLLSLQISLSFRLLISQRAQTYTLLIFCEDWHHFCCRQFNGID